MIGTVLVWSHLPYHYNNEKVAAYATTHAAGGSRSMCAWYVVKAMWRGGCPIGLIPAYAYDKTLPQMGFNEIPTEDYRPMIGDISVLPRMSGASSDILLFGMVNYGCQTSGRIVSILVLPIGRTVASKYFVPRMVGIGSMYGHHL